MSNDIKVIIENSRVISDSIQLQSVNYEGISNKPKINGIELIGDKTSADLGIEVDTSDLATKEALKQGLAAKQDRGDYALKSDIPTVPTLVSELENDSNYATNTEVMQAIASIPQFSLSIVNELPTTGEKLVLYLVPKEGTDKDVYNEYIWLEDLSKFEFLGTTAVDLTEYVKYTDYASSNKAGVILPSARYGTQVGSSGYLVSPTQTLSQYNDYLYTQSFISKGTLENIKDDLVKRGVTENQTELTEGEKAIACNWLGTARIEPITQAAYDALETKDENTLYIIEEE